MCAVGGVEGGRGRGRSFDLPKKKKNGRRPPDSLDLLLLTASSFSFPQRAGNAEVDADQVKAAMQALRADMEASREAARKR